MPAAARNSSIRRPLVSRSIFSVRRGMGRHGVAETPVQCQSMFSGRNVAFRRHRASNGATMIWRSRPTTASSAPMRARNARALPMNSAGTEGYIGHRHRMGASASSISATCAASMCAVARGCSFGPGARRCVRVGDELPRSCVTVGDRMVLNKPCQRADRIDVLGPGLGRIRQQFLDRSAAITPRAAFLARSLANPTAARAIGELAVENDASIFCDGQRVNSVLQLGTGRRSRWR